MRRFGRLAAIVAATTLVGLSASAASAFPPGTCHGTSCSGSAIDVFAGAPVCEPGTATYWEDSYIPADVVDPKLAKFAVTPNPPCTGATIGAPTADPWPASNTDPDGKPAGRSEPGKRIFRFRWTVTVPAGSKSVGTMTVHWTLAWTKPQGTTETTTTTTEGGDRFDIAVTIDGPSSFFARTAPHRLVFHLLVTNHGPGHSPALNGTKNGLSASVDLGNASLELVGLPAGCRQFGANAFCDVHALAPHASESFAIAALWTTADRKQFAAHGKDTVVVEADVNRVSCFGEEVACDNNKVSATARPL